MAIIILVPYCKTNIGLYIYIRSLKGKISMKTIWFQNPMLNWWNPIEIKMIQWKQSNSQHLWDELKASGEPTGVDQIV